MLNVITENIKILETFLFKFPNQLFHDSDFQFQGSIIQIPNSEITLFRLNDADSIISSLIM